MKRKDYFYLAKISLKANKRKKANMTFSLTSSLSFLIPLFFLIFSFYLGAIAEFNSTKAVSSLRTGTSILSMPMQGVEERLNYENYYLSIDATYSADHTAINTDTYIYIDEKEYNIQYHYSSEENKNDISYKKPMFYNNVASSYDCFKFFNINEPLFLESEKAYFNQMGYEDFYQGRTIQNSDEVMISSESLEFLGLKPEDILGKNLSYKTAFTRTFGFMHAFDAEKKPYWENNIDVVGESFYAFKDFKVVGIFNKNIYDCPVRGQRTPPTTNVINTGLEFWFSKEVLYENGKKCVPAYISYYDEKANDYFMGFQYNESPIEYSQQLVDQGKVYLAYGYNNIEFKNSTIITQFKDFQNTYNAYQIMKNAKSTPNVNLTLEKYIVIYPVIVYISVGCGAIGLILFLIMILNLINNFQYLIRSRRGYIGIQKAMGLKDKEVRKLYYYEMIYIGIRSFLYSLIISLVLCVVVKIVCREMTVGLEDLIVPEVVRLSLWYYPLAYIVVALMALVVMLLINFVLCKKVSNQNIIDLLKEQSI